MSQLLKLAFPILIEQILRSLMGTVNTFMLSRISDNAAASVGVANQVLNIPTSLSTLLALGASILINQNLGAGNKKEAGKLSMNSISVVTGVGIVISLFLAVCAQPILGAIGLSPELLPDAVLYLRIIGGICFMQFASATVSTIFRGYGKATIPMYIIVFNNIINISGSIPVVMGIAPLKGVAGIATVRLVSETLGLVLSFFLLSRENWDMHISDILHIKKKDALTILRLGFMSGLEGLSFQTCQLVTTAFIASFPAAVLSAKVYTQTVNVYAYYPGYALGMATQIISGHMIGAGKREEALAFVKKNWRYIAGSNIVCCVLFWIFSRSLIGLFTDSEEIIGIARTLFFIDIITNQGRALNHTFNFSLRSAGYIFRPMIFAVISIWLVQVFGGYTLSVSLGFGIVGIWIAQASDEWLRGLVDTYFWFSRKWMKTQLVEKRSEDSEA